MSKDKMRNLDIMLACFLAELGLDTSLSVEQVLDSDIELTSEQVVFLNTWVDMDIEVEAAKWKALDNQNDKWAELDRRAEARKLEGNVNRSLLPRLQVELLPITQSMCSNQLTKVANKLNSWLVHE